MWRKTVRSDLGCQVTNKDDSGAYGELNFYSERLTEESLQKLEAASANRNRSASDQISLTVIAERLERIAEIYERIDATDLSEQDRASLAGMAQEMRMAVDYVIWRAAKK